MIDRNDFFQNRLRQRQTRLQELKAQHICRNGDWYWDLKPNLKPEDEIPLPPNVQKIGEKLLEEIVLLWDQGEFATLRRPSSSSEKKERENQYPGHRTEFAPNRFFTAAQQQRLADLMDRWRASS